MVPAGFEPAHPKIVELKSTALDHSAMTPNKLVLLVSETLVFIVLNVAHLQRVGSQHAEKLFSNCLIKSQNLKSIAVKFPIKPSAGLEPATLRLPCWLQRST